MLNFRVEGDELIVFDEGGKQIGDAYQLSPWQDAAEVAEWLLNYLKRCDSTRSA